jgi:dipeptidyl aminopeptidase/acylaminoacyl peptidase
MKRLALLCFSALLLAAAPQKPFSLDDAARIVSLSGAQISPDGKKIAVVVSRPDLKSDKNRSQLALVDVASGAMRVLTPTRDEVDAPQWSQDGSQLAFIAPLGEGKDAKPQVWVLPMDGGEARVVTNAENGVDDYSLRPDGKAIAYITRDTPADKKALDEHHDLFVVGDQDFLSHAAPVPLHLWFKELSESAKPRRLNSGRTTDSGPISWSADGKLVAFERGPDPYSPAHFLHDRAVVIDVASGREQAVGTGYNSDATFAPSGSMLAYGVGKNGSSAVQTQLVVSQGASGAAHPLAPEVDRDAQWHAWMPDAKAIAFSAANGTSRDLWIARLDGAVKQIDLGDAQFEDGSVAKDGAIAFVGSSPDDPSELYYLAPGTHALKQLTSENAWIAKERTLGKTVEFKWTNDGFQEDGVLTYPVGFRQAQPDKSQAQPDKTQAQRYPLALVIHGGPTQASSSVGFSSLVQDLANHGMFVLQPNYRGSDNLGFTYADAMIGPEVYVGAGRDVAAGTRALEATGMIDTSRVGVSGWSGGGWMTSWLITNYPDMWKAAVSGAAVDDAVVQYSLEDVTDYLPALFGGLTPWKGNGLAAYKRNSPITYVRNVRTPTLILTDTGDYRVPEPEAFEFYKALRDMGKTVQLVAIPAYGHFPSDPVRRIDTYKRWAGWLEKFLR